MRILQIEDDSATAQSVELMLKSEGFHVFTTDLGEEGIDLAKRYDYDLILLDLNLPDISGVNVLRCLRAGKIHTPIMIVSGTTNIEMKVKTLSGGADDYLCKPFHKDELAARIRAIVRRTKGHAQAVIATGSVVVNLDTRVVEVARKPVVLTAKEWAMLELLVLRKDIAVSKAEFMIHLYNGVGAPETKIIDVFMSRLRKKLAAADPDAARVIDTVWGKGYRLIDPDSSTI
jgi:two-component system, cell cycle response regulator CtrA